MKYILCLLYLYINQSHTNTNTLYHIRLKEYAYESIVNHKLYPGGSIRYLCRTNRNRDT